MHFLDFFAIVGRDLDILNPISREKPMQLVEICDLKQGTRVLDIGCGKGYLLRRWAERWKVEGTGLELNPVFVCEARRLVEAEGVQNFVTVVEGRALEFHVDAEPYDVVTCIGAPFAIGSFEEAVIWMKRALKPGGVLAIGDNFSNASTPNVPRVPEEEYTPLAEKVTALEAADLTLISMIGASTDDWDRYVGGSWRAAHSWAAANPEHPDRAELLRTVQEGRDLYLRFTRQHTGWAIFVARPNP
jgi:ubiquinone/menaquinone biosynthesis C-methylase UbiE